MKLFFSIILIGSITLLTSSTFCQEAQLREDTLQVEAWLATGMEHQSASQPDSAIFYFENARKLAQSRNLVVSEGLANIHLSETHLLQTSSFDSALNHAIEAYSLLRDRGAKTHIAQARLLEGKALTSMGRKEEAASALLETARFNESVGLDSLNDDVYITMAIVFTQLSKPDLEEKYIRKANQLAILYNRKRQVANTTIALSAISRNRGLLDSALYYATEALKASQELKNQTFIAYSYLNLAYAESERERLPEAEQYFQKIFELSSLSPFDRARFQYFFGKFYLKNDRYAEAEKQLSAAAARAQELDANDLLHNTYFELMTVLAQLQDYKGAYQVAKNYLDLSEEVYSKDLRKEIEDLSLKYETEKKEKDNQKLRAENAEQQLQLNVVANQSRQRLWWGLSVTIGLVFMGTGFWFYFLNSKHKQKINEQEALLKEKKLNQLRQEQNYLVLRAMLDGEESERSRMAKELHDSLGSMLSSLKLSLGKRCPEKNGNQGIAFDLVDKASAELRRIAHNLMPQTLLKFGLVAAVEDLCDEISFSYKLQVTFHHYGLKSSISNSVALQLYRIVQELLSNIIKHAEASEAFVQFIQRGEHLFITVEDNGKGFEIAQPGDDGQGLSNVKSRIKYLNGNIHWESAQGRGTTITIDLNLKRKYDSAIHHR